MTPRIPPGDRDRIGRLNQLVAQTLGYLAGTNPPNVFTTLARNRRLFRRWMLFASALMPGGHLPRTDTELLILRTAHLCHCDYEWQHHVRLGAEAGLAEADFARVRQGPDAAGWTPRQATLLRAADELHAARKVSDATWDRLATYLSDQDIIEFCLLVGHYEMLAMTLNTLGVRPDQVNRAPSRLIQLASGHRSSRPDGQGAGEM
jgi:alkylhydroperoxidase family enzyme